MTEQEALNKIHELVALRLAWAFNPSDDVTPEDAVRAVEALLLERRETASGGALFR